MSASADITIGLTPHRKSRLVIACIAWGLLLVGGLGILYRYSTTNGPSADPPTCAEAAIPYSPVRHTLVMAVHPKCPCSRASFSELRRIQERCGNELDTRLYFFRPSTEPLSWTQTELWQAAQTMPNTSVIDDPDGKVASRLGTLTSGAVVLYDTSGKPMFHGGITSARGHEGDNAGADSVIAVVNGFRPLRASTPAYGCEIVDAAPDHRCPLDEP